MCNAHRVPQIRKVCREPTSEVRVALAALPSLEGSIRGIRVALAALPTLPGVRHCLSPHCMPRYWIQVRLQCRACGPRDRPPVLVALAGRTYLHCLHALNALAAPTRTRWPHLPAQGHFLRGDHETAVKPEHGSVRRQVHGGTTCHTVCVHAYGYVYFISIHSLQVIL